MTLVGCYVIYSVYIFFFRVFFLHTVNRVLYRNFQAFWTRLADITGSIAPKLSNASLCQEEVRLLRLSCFFTLGVDDFYARAWGADTTNILYSGVLSFVVSSAACA